MKRGSTFNKFVAYVGAPARGILATDRAGTESTICWFVDVPIRTIGQNAREHFRVKAARVKAERFTVRLCLDSKSTRCPFAPPLVVTLTRLSPSRMDSDGVVGALKHVRDEVASWLKIDDRHDDLVEYRYAQCKAPRGVFAVRISVMPRRGT